MHFTAAMAGRQPRPGAPRCGQVTLPHRTADACLKSETQRRLHIDERRHLVHEHLHDTFALNDPVTDIREPQRFSLPGKTTSFVRDHSAVLRLLTFRFPMAFFGIDAKVSGLTT